MFPSSIKQAQKMIHSREISARELVSLAQKNIDEKNKDINAYHHGIFSDIFDVAEEEDKRILRGEDPKILSGIPFAIKDNILIEGEFASAGSRILMDYKATYSATVIKKLREAGAIFLGRTNMDEFAMGSSTENSAFGSTKNPYDLSRVAGGSSGGSAAAVAMGGCLAALGSDTGGSIRQPANFCGVVGLKPTYGAVSRYGLIAMASSLDQIGPITKTVEDAEIIFNVIKGKDKFDSTSADLKTLNPKPKTLDPLKIGVLKYDKAGVDDDVNKTVDESTKRLKKLGHEIIEIDIPSLEYALACYYIIMFAESSTNLARFDGVRYGLFKEGESLLGDYIKTRSDGFGKEVKRRIMLGTYVLSSGYYDAYYAQAQKVRFSIKKDFENIFKQVDVILLPVSPTPAFKIGEKTSDPLKMYLSDIFTVSANLAGLPAISIPSYFVGGSTKVDGSKASLPTGIQFMAPWFKEDVLFNLGKQYQNGQ